MKTQPTPVKHRFIAAPRAASLLALALIAPLLLLAGCVTTGVSASYKDYSVGVTFGATGGKISMADKANDGKAVVEVRK